MTIRFTGIRLPTAAEQKRGGEIAFDYERDLGSRTVRETVLAARSHEGWEQWGAPVEVLRANTDHVEAWRRGELPGFPCSEPQ